MRTMLAGAAMLLGSTLALPVAAQSVDEEIQNEEDPGSEIQMDVGPRGQFEVGRERTLDGQQPGVIFDNQGLQASPGNSAVPAAPQGVQVNPGQAQQLLDDPDAPTADDPIDAEEPGEGPEDLGGPTGETDEPD